MANPHIFNHKCYEQAAKRKINLNLPNQSLKCLFPIFNFISSDIHTYLWIYMHELQPTLNKAQT